MIKGLYIANTGLNYNQKALNTIGGNLANVNTSGYKQQDIAASTFKEALVSKNGQKIIGSTSHGVKLDEIKTDYTMGSIQETNREFDYAIKGDAFFTLELPDGSYQYTRNGAFQKDAEGYLVDNHGFKVQGEQGSIMVEDGKPDQEFALTNFENLDDLRKVGENLYITNDEEGANWSDNSTVMQGFLESSNVDLVKNMGEMLTYSRFLSFNSKVLSVQDRILEKSASEIGSIRG
ncbi:flagellar basal-body rod protein FlgG [Desulfonispora thiosulfatigenes DSM 11270]|uniref:Flagellar basal-body rod protein FlgG n=1 Tax=Desulfonispora thiosulfatigenes DSM 11270 TaxID=656914 RepID=A0A1W1UMA4_DESTI|nr:flagellar hook-basal body protein [Desulfonispora thiosulfatigenes]SMB82268.1 flagellar basal-body rod protein FlgG [Desulfonispora thiosulfatigenes DSM 11270]